MVRLRHLPVPVTSDVLTVRAVCTARQWIGTDDTQNMILKLRLPAGSYQRFDVYFHGKSSEKFRDRLLDITNTRTRFFLPLWYQNHFTVLTGEGANVHIFDPFHGRWGRYHPPPMDTIQSVFPQATFVPLPPGGLQRDPTDTFCVIWGVWFMSGAFDRNSATMHTLFRWVSNLMQHKALRADFKAYMVTDLKIKEPLARKYVEIISNITASKYNDALDRTPMHLDDPDAPLFAQTRSRRLRNAIIHKAIHRGRARLENQPSVHKK